MSIQLLRDKVYEKCEIKLVDFDKLEEANKTQIHKIIRKEFALELRTVINSFVAELSKHALPKKKNEIVLNFKELFCSKEFKGIFQYDIHYSNEYKEKCIEKCEIKDFRTTRSFLFENNNDLDKKSKDFYCLFLGKLGWNSWVEELSPADYIISVEHNNRDNSIVQRYEIRDLPKVLNSVPVLEIENYIPRIPVLEEISNLFEQKNKKININGISGIGKTFLAKHFVLHYSEKFSHIVWLNCSSGIVMAFTQGKAVKLLDVMGLASEYKSHTEGNMSADGLMSMVLGRLQNIKSNSLLVLDNIDEEVYDYEDEIQLTSNWKILTTSQEKLDGFQNFTAPFFDDKSIALFYKYYTLEKDDDNLIRLLSAIEYHTLTIELLAKTAQQRQLNIIQLVNRFIENGINVVDKVKVTVDHSKERKIKIENIEEYLNIIFDTSLLCDEECKILLNIALLYKDSIEIDLFREVFLSNSKDRKIIDSLFYDINGLTDKGWIEIDNNGIRIHSLIKAIIIKRFLHRKDFFESTIKYLIEKLEVELDAKTNIDKIIFLTLSESILEHIKKDNKETILLKESISSFYAEIGLYEKAKKIELERLEQLLESENILEKNELIKTLYTLSFLSDIQGYNNDALNYSLKLFSYFDEDIQKNLHYSLKESLKSFFIVNKIQSLTDLEKGFDLSEDIKMFDLILNSNYIIIKNQSENDLYRTINRLEALILIRQDFLEIFKKNIPIGLIFDIDIYKTLLLSNAYLLRKIGYFYLKLKQYDKAVEFTKKTLDGISLFLSEDDVSFSYVYDQFTRIFIESENLENARYYLAKNGLICIKLPANHPAVKLYNKRIKDFEDIEFNNTLSKNIDKILKSKFEKLYKTNTSFTSIIDYYSTLSSTYFICKDYKKANEYVKKEITFRFNIDKKEDIDYIEIINLYLNSGYCYFYLNNFKKPLKLYNKAFKLYEDKGIIDEKCSSNLLLFRNFILEKAFQYNQIYLIRLFILIDLNSLEEQSIISIFNSPNKDNLTYIIKKLFVFLNELPYLEKMIECVEQDSDNMNFFLTEYDIYYVKILKKLEKHEQLDDHLLNLHYSILDQYYFSIINIFLKYKKWDVALGYSKCRLFLNEQCFNESELSGTIHYTNGCCYFMMDKFELALEETRKAIQIYSNVAGNINKEAETIEEIKFYLKESLNLEKSIIKELDNYKYKGQ